MRLVTRVSSLPESDNRCVSDGIPLVGTLQHVRAPLQFASAEMPSTWVGRHTKVPAVFLSLLLEIAYLGL